MSCLTIVSIRSCEHHGTAQIVGFDILNCMKEVLIIRHSIWDGIDDKLTLEGTQRCLELKSQLGLFATAVASPLHRSQETAQLLSELKPLVDDRASILQSPPEFKQRIATLRNIHPLGVAGAIISIPELHDALRQQGQRLLDLVIATLNNLVDGQRALIVSHDGTMVASEKILKNEEFDEVDHTFNELEGFWLNESMHIIDSPLS